MAIVALNSLGHQIWELPDIQGGQGAGTSEQAGLEQRIQMLEEQVQQLEKENGLEKRFHPLTLQTHPPTNLLVDVQLQGCPRMLGKQCKP